MSQFKNQFSNFFEFKNDDGSTLTYRGQEISTMIQAKDNYGDQVSSTVIKYQLYTDGAPVIDRENTSIESSTAAYNHYIAHVHFKVIDYEDTYSVCITAGSTCSDDDYQINGDNRPYDGSSGEIYTITVDGHQLAGWNEEYRDENNHKQLTLFVKDSNGNVSSQVLNYDLYHLCSNPSNMERTDDEITYDFTSGNAIGPTYCEGACYRSIYSSPNETVFSKTNSKFGYYNETTIYQDMLVGYTCPITKEVALGCDYVDCFNTGENDNPNVIGMKKEEPNLIWYYSNPHVTKNVKVDKPYCKASELAVNSYFYPDDYRCDDDYCPAKATDYCVPIIDEEKNQDEQNRNQISQHYEEALAVYEVIKMQSYYEYMRAKETESEFSKGILSYTNSCDSIKEHNPSVALSCGEDERATYTCPGNVEPSYTCSDGSEPTTYCLDEEDPDGECENLGCLDEEENPDGVCENPVCLDEEDPDAECENTALICQDGDTPDLTCPNDDDLVAVCVTCEDADHCEDDVSFDFGMDPEDAAWLHTLNNSCSAFSNCQTCKDGEIPSGFEEDGCDVFEGTNCDTLQITDPEEEILCDAFFNYHYCTKIDHLHESFFTSYESQNPAPRTPVFLTEAQYSEGIDEYLEQGYTEEEIYVIYDRESHLEQCISEQKSICLSNYDFCNEPFVTFKKSVLCSSADVEDGPFYCRKSGYLDGYCLEDDSTCTADDSDCQQVCYKNYNCTDEYEDRPVTFTCHGYYSIYQSSHVDGKISLQKTKMRVCPEFMGNFSQFYIYNENSSSPFIIFNPDEIG